MKKGSVKERLDHAEREFQHSKMKFVLYAGFSRSDVNHSYRYVASEMSIKPDESHLGSWDIVMADTAQMKNGKFVPIFVEVKSHYKKNQKLIKALIDKIIKTRELVSSGGISVLLKQIPSYNGGELKFNLDDFEYAVFVPNNGSLSLIDYISENEVQLGNKIPLIVWTYGNSDFDHHAIEIPYIGRNGTKPSRNIMDSTDWSGDICFCKHNQEDLNRWFERPDFQKLETGGTMPPKLTRYWIDPAVAITIALSSGKIIYRQEKYITVEDLKSRFKDLYSDHKVNVKDEEIESYIRYMIKMGVFKIDKSVPIEPLRINSKVKKLLTKSGDLLQDIVKRAVNYGIDPSSGFFE